MKKECIFKKETFLSFQKTSLKDGKAENMPVVAGHLDLYFIVKHS